MSSDPGGTPDLCLNLKFPFSNSLAQSKVHMSEDGLWLVVSDNAWITYRLFLLLYCFHC